VPAGSDASGTLEKIRQGQVDVLTFASPSAFHHLSEEIGVERLRELAGVVTLAAIGPATAKAVAETGLPVAIEASESTVQGLTRAIVEYFEKQGSETKTSKREGAKVP